MNDFDADYFAGKKMNVKTKRSKKALSVVTTVALVVSLCLPAFPITVRAYAEDDVRTPVESLGENEGAINPELSADPSTEAMLAEAPRDEADDSAPAPSSDPSLRDNRDSVSPTVIENLSISWEVNGNRQVLSDDDVKLTVSPKDNGWASSSWEELTVSLEYKISGSTDHVPGSIVITVPGSVLPTRAGYTPMQEFSSPIPQAPTNEQNEFNWTYTGGNYVIKNCKTISGADEFTGSVSFTIKRPSTIPDGSLKDFAIQMTITDPGEEPIQATSNTLQAEIDTFAEISEIGKVARDFYSTWQSSWGEKPADADDYYYVVWGLRSNALPSSNQPYTWTVQDSPESGEIIGRTALKLGDIYSRESYASSTSAFMDADADTVVTQRIDQPDNRNYQRTANIYWTMLELVRYPKAELDDGQSHVLSNSFTATVTPKDGQDPATTKTATASFTYEPIEFDPPAGKSIFRKDGPSSSQEIEGGLDILAAGDALTLSSYTISGDVTGYPYTLGEGMDPSSPDSYGQRPYKIILSDDYAFPAGSGTMEFGAGDYEITSITLSEQNWDWVLNDSTRQYEMRSVSNNDRYEPIVVYGRFDSGSWVELGTMEGYQRFAPAYAGVSSEGRTVTLPEGVLAVKAECESTSAKTYISMSLSEKLLPSERVIEWAGNVPENGRVTVENIASFLMLDADGGHHEGGQRDSIVNSHLNRITQLDKQYHGSELWNHDTAENRLTKAKRFGSHSKNVVVANEPSQKRVKLTYTTSTYDEVRLHTYTYDAAQIVEHGMIEPQESGTFYDLLPLGVEPDLSSVEALVYQERNMGSTMVPYDDQGTDDPILVGAEAVPNWNGTGRTMLIAQVANSPHLVNSYQTNGYQMVYSGFRLTFDAYYPWDSLMDYGTEVINSIAYMSDNDTLYNGGPDDGKPTSVGRLLEPDILVDLDGDGVSGEGAPANVWYTSNRTVLNVPTTAEASLTKRVRGGEVTSWVDGVEEGTVNVDVAEPYQYRLRYATGNGTTAKNLILFDSLENYAPEEDSADYQGDQWRGELESVDTTQLERKGIAPVVYYSTVAGLDIEAHKDLSEESVWSTAAPSDLASVTAIAIDCRKATDGSDFALQENSSIVAIVNMKASDDESEVARLYYADAHAFNQVYMNSLISTEGGSSTTEMLFHNEYTKVGLLEPQTDVSVTKEWNVPEGTETPESVTVHLLANGEPALDDDDAEITAELNDDVEWAHTFAALPKYDAAGALIQYTVAEDVPDGFQYDIEGDADEGFTITNELMQPVDIDLAAKKQMVGRSFEEGDSFTFKIEASGDAEMPDGVDEDGTVTIEPTEGSSADVAFGSVSFASEGSFTYTISEVAGNDSDIKYDSKTVTATVAVERGSNGALTATVTYGDSEDAPEFANVYYEKGEAVLEATKILAEADGSTDKLAAGKFSFELLDANGEVIQTAQNGYDLDGNGSISGADEIAAVRFTLEYGLADAGESFTYTVREVAGSQKDMVYDKHEASYTVAVEDGGEGTLVCTVTSDQSTTTFTNKVLPPDKDSGEGGSSTSSTGDMTPIAPLVAVAFAAFAMAAFARKKRVR